MLLVFNLVRNNTRLFLASKKLFKQKICRKYFKKSQMI